MKKHLRYSLFILFLSIMSFASGQIAIQTSFEDYNTGSITGQNSWNNAESGSSNIVVTSSNIHSGTKAVQLSASSSLTFQLDHMAFSKTKTGLSGNVYFDCWIKINSAPGSEVFHISGYDLTPDGSEKRAFVFEFAPTSGSSGDIKIYDGSSRSAYSSYSVGEWHRISAHIDYSSLKYEVAIDGLVINKEFNFRESYNATEKGRSTDIKEYHLLRFYYENDYSDIAIDDLYIGTTEIPDIVFTEVSNERSLTVIQPENGTIKLDPEKAVYEVGDTIRASINVDDHYKFVEWTGSYSGSDNPLLIIIDANSSIGAKVDVDPLDPPAEFLITLTQTKGGNITVSPPTGPYYEGNTVTFTATPEIGYDFDSWSGIEGSETSQTIEIKNDLLVSAVFTEGNYSERIVNVSNADEFENALKDLQPGDHIIVAGGTYNGIGVSLESSGGTPSSPVIIESANQDEVKIIGDGQFSLTNCAYISFKGFVFDVEVYTLFKLTGCNNIRLSHNVFKNSGDGGSKLILIGDEWESTVSRSHHNRIDYNLFDGKSDGGAWVVIDGCHGDGGDFQVSQYDRIDHNHFRFNGPRVSNEKETIRVGMSDLSLSSGFCTIENNLFEECDGDPEIISVKSCDNYVRNNTFFKCLGTVSLRHGNRSEVSGNFFLGREKTSIFEGNTIGCGGVRVYGKDHKIFNNYFEGLTGSLWDAACTLTQGDASNIGVTQNSDLTKHYVVENLEFCHNTLVNNKSDIEIGYRTDWGKIPLNSIIANNIIVQNVNPVVKIHESGSDAGLVFADNIIYTTGEGSLGDKPFSALEAENVDPQLIYTSCRAVEDNCTVKIPEPLYKLSSGSPAIDKTTSNIFDYVNFDMEGQGENGLRDLGADEHNSSSIITNGILSSEFVGPDAMEFAEILSNSSSDFFENELDLELYPNPFTHSTNFQSKETVIVSIYNTQGKLIDSFQMDNSYQWTAPYRGIFIGIVKSKTKYSRIILLSK